jgi:hypothetical protein
MKLEAIPAPRNQSLHFANRNLPNPLKTSGEKKFNRYTFRAIQSRPWLCALSDSVAGCPRLSFLNSFLTNGRIASSSSTNKTEANNSTGGVPHAPRSRGRVPRISSLNLLLGGWRPFAPRLKLRLPWVKAVEVRGAASFAVCAKGASSLFFAPTRPLRFWIECSLAPRRPASIASRSRCCYTSAARAYLLLLPFFSAP